MRGAPSFVLGLLMLIACGEVITPAGTGGSSGAGGSGSTGTATSGTTSSAATTSTSTGSGAVCVVGQGQTCNDEPSASAIWGTCEADGTCVCNPGYEVNPATGHCRIPPDGGAGMCGDVSCKENEFCIERVHDQDAGPVPPTWMCELYFTCMEHTCACAIMSFVSASCISPKCVSEDPVWIRCDDLN